MEVGGGGGRWRWEVVKCSGYCGYVQWLQRLRAVISAVTVGGGWWEVGGGWWVLGGGWWEVGGGDGGVSAGSKRQRDVDAQHTYLH